MKKSPYLLKHSPEKIFLAVAFLCLLGYEGFFLFCKYRQRQNAEEKQQNREEIADAGISRKIEALRWLAPFKTMNYQNNPFDIGFKLKKRPPEPEKKKMPKTVVAVKKTPQPPVKKIKPKPSPLPPVLYRIEYRGTYISLDGVSYAIIQAEDGERRISEKLTLKKGERILEKFYLLEFDDAAMVIALPGGEKKSVLWNQSREFALPRTPSGSR